MRTEVGLSGLSGLEGFERPSFPNSFDLPKDRQGQWFSKQKLLEIPRSRLCYGLPVGESLGMEHVTASMVMVQPDIAREIGWIVRTVAQNIQVEKLAAVLTSDARIFFGVHRHHAHPVCAGDAVEAAIGTAVVSGAHSIALCAKYDASFPAERSPINGAILERLAEHFCLDDAKRDMVIVRAEEESGKTWLHSGLLPEPHGGMTRPIILADSSRVSFESISIKLSPDLLKQRDPKPPEYFLRRVSETLRGIIVNSTADGESRPGRKRHAAAVWTADGDVFYGVNLRGDVQCTDRCAEWNAISSATLAGRGKELIGVFVHSPDYEDGSVCCCGRCLNSLGDTINPKWGNMFIVYMNSGTGYKIKLYSDPHQISYAAAEAGPYPKLA